MSRAARGLGEDVRPLARARDAGGDTRVARADTAVVRARVPDLSVFSFRFILARKDLMFLASSDVSDPLSIITRFHGCDLRAVCESAGATDWASDWAAPGLSTYLLPPFLNGTWTVLLTFHIVQTRRLSGRAFNIPNKVIRPLGRLAGAGFAIAGSTGTYLTHQNAYETARGASAELSKVTPRTQHVGWYFCLIANCFVIISGVVATLFGRGALFGPSKKQQKNRIKDDDLLRVISNTPDAVQIGITPTGERVMQIGQPAPSGTAHFNFNAFSRRENRNTEKMTPPKSWTHRSRGSVEERARERMRRERLRREGRSPSTAGTYGESSSSESGSEYETSSGEDDYFDMERGRVNSDSRITPQHVEQGQGGWEQWKANFWKSGAGAVAAARAVTGGGQGSSTSRSEDRTSEKNKPVDPTFAAYRTERDEHAERLKNLVKSPEVRNPMHTRPNLHGVEMSAMQDLYMDRSTRGQPHGIGRHSASAGLNESPFRTAMRINATVQNKPSPTPVYELSSSDEEFGDDLGNSPAMNESIDLAVEAQSPLLSPSGRREKRMENSNASHGELTPLSLRQKADLAGNRMQYS